MSSVVTAKPAPTALLGAADRHLVSRFSYGITPDLAHQVRAQGGAEKWFERQLALDPLTADTHVDDKLDWWPHLKLDALPLWNLSKGGVGGGFKIMLDYQRYLLVRRMYATCQVREVMAEFWQNHLNVPINGEQSFVYRRQYGEMVRRAALGSFRDLLFAAVTHPAMGIYLDNAISTRTTLNENLGRELLELHTVGLGAGYTDEEVVSSARILTGWRVDADLHHDPTWRVFYNPPDHYTGAVEVLGFTDANAAADGQALTRRYLDFLARHELTAERIATKLCVKFVSDDAPASLVARLKQTYLDNDTEIVPVLRALIASKEFKRTHNAKVRDPGEDVVATYRVLGVKLKAPQHPDSAANLMLFQSANAGLLPFAWPRPDGAPITNDAWATPSRMLASFNAHTSLSGGYFPPRGSGIVYRPDHFWLPRLPTTQHEVIDHMSRLVLHRPATPAIVRACALATGYPPEHTVKPGGGIAMYGVPAILNTLLDSPTHFTR